MDCIRKTPPTFPSIVMTLHYYRQQQTGVSLVPVMALPPSSPDSAPLVHCCSLQLHGDTPDSLPSTALPAPHSVTKEKLRTDECTRAK